MKLSASVTALLLSFGDVAEARRKTGKRTEDCDESGYEVWRQNPLQDAKVKVEARVDCDTETYTLTYSFEPDLNLPYINDVTATDLFANTANPERLETCAAEGLGTPRPGPPENVPEGTHVGQNVHYTDYGYSYETSGRIQEATGFKLLTLGAGPCGTPTQVYPHYSIHFYLVDADARKEMLCVSDGGYFCKSATVHEQCGSDAAIKMNLNGTGIDRCEDGTTYANVPPGFNWNIDGNLPLNGYNAGAPGMGLHGLILADLAGAALEDPIFLMVQYDGNIVANHVVIWGGTALGENDPNNGDDFHWDRPTPDYNCQNKEKYPSLPTNTVVDYVAAEGRTYTTVSGPTSQCTESFTEIYDSTVTPAPVPAPATPAPASTTLSPAPTTPALTGKSGKGGKKGKSGKKPEDACEENGYEVWQARPPEAAKLKSEARVDCDTETYTLNLSFEPDVSIPYINDVTATDLSGNTAHPERPATCAAEGLGTIRPGPPESVPEGTHVGQNVHYTDYGYSYETSGRIQEATGFKLLTLGAAPCGTPTQPYPHYSIHFYLVDVEARKEMTCFSNGGYFCLPRTQLPEQCSDTGIDFNLDGVGVDKCEDGTTDANVFPGLQWTIDGNPAISINAGSPGMGLHGLNLADLRPPVDVTSPVLLMVQYDGNIVANHVVIWGGTPLGENNPGGDFSLPKPTPVYNCQDKEKYPSLPTNTVVDYVAEEGRTYVTISGPTSQCTESFTEVYDSTELGPSGKSGKKKVGKAGKGRNKQRQVFD